MDSSVATGPSLSTTSAKEEEMGRLGMILSAPLQLSVSSSCCQSFFDCGIDYLIALPPARNFLAGLQLRPGADNGVRAWR